MRITIRKLHNIVVGLYIVLLLIFDWFIPVAYRELALRIVTISGMILVLGSLYFFAVDWRQNKVRSIAELTSIENKGNYLQIWFLFFISNFDFIHPFGTAFYLTIAVLLLLFCVFIVVRDMVSNRTVFTGVIIAHSLLGYFMYSWSKVVYVRNYGTEVIGNFWEKPNYKATYVVRLRRSKDDQAYSLPGALHVYTERFNEDFGDGDKSWTEKFIMLEGVYFDNGGYITFDDCNLIDEDEVYCHDHDGEGWYIQLTKQKIE